MGVWNGISQLESRSRTGLEYVCMYVCIYAPSRWGIYSLSLSLSLGLGRKKSCSFGYERCDVMNMWVYYTRYDILFVFFLFLRRPSKVWNIARRA